MTDFIIVGGGSAGCVLAARLSEDPTHSVLLLEAGASDTHPEIHIPATFSRLFQTEVDWNYHTEPQAGAADRALYWPRGKVLGGSSSINAMIYIRGHHDDFEGWAADGCTGWGFSDVLPYFKRSEDNEWGESAFHGAGGPLRVEDPKDPSPVSLAFLDAAVAAGMPLTDDFNGIRQTGASLYQLTQKKGRRASAATAFLKPALRRPNLTVRTGAMVQRILVEHGRAVGVEVAHEGRLEALYADREVIVCGGAVNSPQLLMLSGIGPADHLREHGIEVVADRPAVGENLHDHLITGLHYELREPVSLVNADRFGSVLRYLFSRRGMLASNIAEAGLFVDSTGGGGVPDLQFHVAPILFTGHGLTPPTDHGFSIGPTLVRPKSRGRLRLRSSDPADHPAIDPQALADPADVDVLVAGIRLAREIAEVGPLDRFRGERLTPSPSSFETADIARHVRETAETLYHPVGTCRMGGDDDAVVDLDLRVRGGRPARGRRFRDADDHERQHERADADDCGTGGQT